MAPASCSISPQNVNCAYGRRSAWPSSARPARWRCGRQVVAFVVALGLAAMAFGFAVPTIKTALIAHPVLRYSTSGVTIGGYVELREESQHTDRFVLRVDHMEGGRMDEKPQRVRLSVKRGMAPDAGSYVEVKAMLDPPMQPLEPGSYDFARDMFFQGIGASGFVRGAIKIVAPPAPQDVWQSADSFIQDLRNTIDARIRAVLPGDPGAIAAMLINGRRDVINQHLYDAVFVSGIGHVLSIPGYHMAVVAGMIFFLFRAGLALVPGLADRPPIKKWALRRALGDRLLSDPVRQSGGDAAFLHHDRGRADRRDARPANADLAHAHGRCAHSAVFRAGRGGASELPDVVCGDAGAGRRLRARRRQGESAQGQFAWRARRALGR
jgi:hypothetical protein